MPNEAHPTRDKILAYSTGRLDDQSSERIAEHISTCDTCHSVLTAVDDGHDSVVARLRRVVPPDPYAQEPECQAALVAAKGQLDASWPRGAEPRSASAAGDPSGFAAIDRTESLDRLPPAEDLPQLGDYQLLEKLGEGGMGAVHQARHLRLDRVVALKILPKERTQDQAAVARFAREMKAVGRLNHPNIVQAHDARDIDGTTVLVMEYVDGHDLSEVVRLAKPLRIADACELVRQAAVGLQHAHEHGLVHRDVKPSNLMLAADLSLVSGPLLGEEKELNADSRPLKAIVKILDLGLARLASDAPANGELTSEGQAMGTADYIAPEQISDSHSADIRADIYSLGCTLYKLLTDQPPFAGPKYKSMMDKMTGHLRDEPRPIGELRSDVPAGLIAVLERMMAKDREQRYATPREVSAALAPFAAGANLDHLARCVAAGDAGEPLPPLPTKPYLSSPMTGTSPSCQVGPGRRTGPAANFDVDRTPGSAQRSEPTAIATAIRQAIRGPALLIALGLFGVLIAFGLVIIRIHNNDGTQTEVAIPTGSSATVNPDGSVDVKLPDGSPQKLLKKAVASGRPSGDERGGSPISANAIVSRPAQILGVRSWSVGLTGHQGQVLAVAWSPKGDLIATGDMEDSSIRIWDREGHLQKVLLGHDASVGAVAFSPDGSLLASSDMGGTAATYQMRVWDVSKGTCLRVIRSDVWLWCVAFSPNGENLAVATSPLTFVNLRTQARSDVAQATSAVYVNWSPNGRQVVTVHSPGYYLEIWDAATLKKLADIRVSDAEGKPIGLTSGVWSPDGRLIAAACSDGAWRIWDAATFELRTTLRREGRSPEWNARLETQTSLFWMKSGQLVTAAKPNRLLTWDAAKGEVVAEVDFPAESTFALSPDGSEIVTHPLNSLGGECLNFLDSATGKSLRRGTGRGQSESGGVALSPDGQQVVTFEKGRLAIWNSNTAQPVTRNANAGNLSHSYTWQPSGGLIVAANWDSPENAPSLFSDDTLASALKLKRVENGVSIYAWSPDGRLLAAADKDNTIRVWDIANQEVISNLVGHEAEVRKLAWSPDGKRLASRSADKTVRLWDPVNGGSQQTFKAFPEPIADHMLCQGLAWTPDSQRLWIALTSHAVQLEVATGKFSHIERFSNDNFVMSLAVSADGQHLLAREMYGWTYLRTVNVDVSLREPNAAQGVSGQPSRRLLGNGLGRYPVWHPDSRRFLGHEPNCVVTFDIQANRRLGTLFPWITGNHWMCVSPEGHVRGGHFKPRQTEFDPADTAIPASLKEQIVYVALLDDGSQVTLSPDEFAARFGWQNDPNQAYLLGPTP